MSNKSPKEGIYMTMYVERNKIKLAKHGLCFLPSLESPERK